MAFEHLGVNTLDYNICEYGKGKTRFRGPKIALTGDYFVAVGGSETFGKFVELPFPRLLEKLTGEPTANLGQMYSGADLLSGGPDLLEICRRAQAVIVQLPGVPNMTNRFYSVHPRRNDRFLRPTKLLRSMYRGVDFSDIHFTGHLMNTLYSHERDQFQVVLDGLRDEWVSRMKSLISHMLGPVVLLWMADHTPGVSGCPKSAWREPMFVDREMLDQVSVYAEKLVEVVGLPEEISAGFERMVFSPMEEPSAEQMLGPIVHQEVARQLQIVLAGI